MKNDEVVHTLKNAIVEMATKVHTTHIFTQNLLHLSTINDEYRRLLSETFSVFRSVIKKVMDYGQNQNNITKGISSDEIAMDIQNIYVGTLTNWVFSNGNGTLEILMDQTLGNYLQGISCSLLSD